MPTNAASRTLPQSPRATGTNPFASSYRNDYKRRTMLKMLAKIPTSSTTMLPSMTDESTDVLVGIENSTTSSICEDFLSPQKASPRLVSQRKQNQKASLTDEDALVAKETREINRLRASTFILLVIITAVASNVVFWWTGNVEREKFEDSFSSNAQHIIDAFHDALERRLGAINTLSHFITSHALSTGEEFPCVTTPNFEVLARDLRVSANALEVSFLPIVTSESRRAWEEYALSKRFHVDEASDGEKILQNNQEEPLSLDLGYMFPNNATILADDSRYHPRIWSKGGDEKEGVGPTGSFLPLWQRSPVNHLDQGQLNFNFANTMGFRGVVQNLQRDKKGLMSHTTIEQLHDSRKLYSGNPQTMVVFPVFDSFGADRQVVGVLAVNLYWRDFFRDILPASTNASYLCILENSYDQTLAYRISGQGVVYLGTGDPHDTSYDHLEQYADVNHFVHLRQHPFTMLNSEFGKYQIHIFPTIELEQAFLNSQGPLICVGVVLFVFLITAVLLDCLDRHIKKRQKLVMDRFLKSAEETAAFEHDLNAFLAHEVRNPVAAAMTAHGFLDSNIRSIYSDNNKTPKNPSLATLQEDVQVIGSSLLFVDEFLRSTLDLHASASLEIHPTPTNLLKDVFEPVGSILRQREGPVHLEVECADNLVVSTDCLRLKQVMMNLGRNGMKFTKQGFVRFRAAVVNGSVELYVEDSGGGIPVNKRTHLFQKAFREPLAELCQGVGIGISLCDSLIRLMNGNLSLDGTYDSKLPGSPGARFVVKLNTPVLPAADDSILLSKDSIYSNDCIKTAISSESPTATMESRTRLEENLAVLFVDDDKILRRLFSRAIKKVAPSWSISEAACGEAALQCAQTQTFDLIFMDQYMASTEKQMLGTETVAELRNSGIDCTICGLSANNMEEEFLNAGSEAFLLKPLPCARGALERELIRITGIRKVGVRNTSAGPQAK